MYRNCLVIPLIILFVCDIAAQQFTNYSLEDGLPQSQVYALCEDQKGYLWLGTQGGGLCRFDGIRFEVFNAGNGLGSNFINAILEDDKGRIWFGTQNGLSVYDGKGFQIIADFNLPVYALAQQPSGQLLMGTARGLWQVDFATLRAVQQSYPKTLDQIAVFALHIEADGDCYVGSQRGIYTIAKKDNKALSINALYKKEYNPVYAFAKWQNKLWCADLNAGLLAIDLNSNKLLEAPRMDSPTRMIALAIGQEGQLWAGTQSDGLLQFDGNTGALQKKMGENDGLPHSHVRSLLYDHHKRLWLGTSGGGLSRLGSQAFRRFDRSNGLPGNRIYAICEDRQKRIWVAAAQNGLAMMDSTGWQAIRSDSGYLQGVKCRTLACDATGNIWVGTEGKGVLCLSKAGNQFFNKAAAWLPSDWVQKILCDLSNGDIWIATAEGLVLLTRTPEGLYNKRIYGLKDGLPGTSITALQLDPKGNLWFGTLGGKIGVLQQKKIALVLGPENGLPGSTVTAIVFDRENHCWVATKGKGVWHGEALAGGRFTALEGISSGNVYLLAMDQSGRFWAGSESGVDAFGPGKADFTVQHFGKSEGFTGIETCQDAVLNDGTGHLWFGTMNGLMQYLPNAQLPVYQAPKLHFEHISLFYKPIAETDYADKSQWLFDPKGPGLQLPWNQNHLSFAFKAIDLSRDDAMKYRWKLADVDTDWSPWHTQNTVNYANLAPGSYRLWVQAAGSNLAAPSQAIFAAFTIRLPFWKTWTFILSSFILSALMLFWGIKTYVGRLKSKELASRAQLELKNRLLQLEQKALQLQMNPHFIFNALNSIQSLIATQDYAVARQEITQFAKLMRGVLHNSRKTAITLQEEMDTLSHYLRVEQFCQQNTFSYEVNVDKHIETDQISIPPMLLQPFVENAVVHGVSHLDYPGHIAVSFSLKGNILLTKIRDNGVGREKAALLREAKKPGHQSAAMQVTQERLSALGGTLVISDGADKGTVVEVYLPLETLPEE